MLTSLIAGLAIAGPWPTQPGTHQLEHTIDGTVVRFTVHVPAELPKRPRPGLVLALHYAGHGAPHYATAFVDQLVAPGFEAMDAYILAPDCPGTQWTDPEATALTLALLDQALTSWKVDPKKVIVTGYSMGGMGTWHVAAHHPERFAAAIPMAGHPRDHAPRVTIPVYAIHGGRDELIPPGPSRAAIDGLRQRGVRARFDEEHELSHYDVPAYVPALERAVHWIDPR